VREQVMEEVNHAFRPEFLNWLDKVLLFTHLSRTHMTDIVEIQLSRLRKLLTARRAFPQHRSRSCGLATARLDPSASNSDLRHQRDTLFVSAATAKSTLAGASSHW
jgi:hypothetical protein